MKGESHALLRISQSLHVCAHVQLGKERRDLEFGVMHLYPLALDSWGTTMVNFAVGSMDLESARRHSFRYVQEGVSGEA